MINSKVYIKKPSNYLMKVKGMCKNNVTVKDKNASK